jgi:hypothetical protein
LQSAGSQLFRASAVTPLLKCVPMLFQERLKKLILASEVRLAEPVEGLGQVNDASTGGRIENAERSHYCEPFGFSGGNTGAIIHEDCVDLARSGQDNRCSFSAIEPQQDRVFVCIRRRNDGNPRRRVSDPRTNAGRRSGVRELILHFLRHVYGFKKRRNEVDTADQH